MRTKPLLIVFAIILFLSAGTKAAAGDYVIPEDVQIAAEKYGEEYGISPELILAIIRYESCYIPTVSNGNCKGLMQVNDVVHKERMKKLGVTDIYDVDGNIHVGTDFIAEMYDEYGDIGIVLGLYHGEKKAISNGRKGIYSKYTQKILKKASDLEDKRGITDGTED